MIPDIGINFPMDWSSSSNDSSAPEGGICRVPLLLDVAYGNRKSEKIANEIESHSTSDCAHKFEGELIRRARQEVDKYK